MNRRLRVFLVLFFLSLLLPIHHATAADWDPVTKAERTMKSNALDPGSGALVLFKRGQIDILEKQSLFWTTRIVTYIRIKVFNEAGREAANVAVEAPKYMRLAKVEGRTILPSGEVVPLDPTQVFRGRAYEAGKNFTIMKTSFTFPSVEPGAIIEFQTEEFVDWFYPPPWVFDTDGLGTLLSTLRVIVGPRLGMSQFPMDTTLSRLSLTQKDVVQGKQYDYSVQNLRPIRREPFSVPFRDMATTVLFTPNSLAFQNQVYPLIEKWDDVAADVSEQVAEMNKSSKEARNKAKELAGKLPDPRSRAEAIYRYIQQNVESSGLAGIYVSRKADEVLADKRGDPDEINALFMTMLKEVKVDADIALVAAQNWRTLAVQFPNRSQFSGVITRVNLKEGAIFTDPSDPAAPFGELPWFERGITAMVVDGKKMQQVAIPAGVPEENLSVMKVSFAVSRDWKAEGAVEVEMKGAEAIGFRSDLMGEAPAKLDQRLTDYFSYGYADAAVSDLSYPDLHDSSKDFVLKARIQHQLVETTGPGQLLLNPWLYDQYSSPLFKSSERHSAVRFPNPEKRVSTTVWQLPAEITVQQLPKNVSVENNIGSFSHACTRSDAAITCTRTFVLKKTQLQTTGEYLNARAFFDEIAKNDQEVMVLRSQ